MRKLLLAFGISLIASAAPATAKDFSNGFGEDTIESFNQSAEKKQPALFNSESERQDFSNFATRAGLLRLSIISDSPELLSEASANERAQISKLYQDGSLLEKDLWKHFFEGSTIFIGNAKASTKRVGYHNAFIDGWVLTNWTKQGDTYRLTELTTRTGEALSGYQAQEYAPWFSAEDTPLVVSFYENASSSAATFKNKYPEFSTKSPGGVPGFNKADYTILKNRLFVAGSSIVSMVRSEEYNKLLSKFLQANIEGDTGEIKSMVKDKDQVAPLERLAMQPSEIRASQRLMNIAKRGNEYTALYASPIKPDQIMFIDIRPNRSEKPELSQVLVVNLKQ
jgi:hypothetical protein